MQPKSDAQLLRDYAESGAEAAFTELVHRHTNLVYSAARRQVEAPDTAAEIAQRVFIGLARGAQDLAPRLAPAASLAGWLCRSARNLALNHRRDEFRRHTRERLAMDPITTTPETAPDWDHLRHVLDDALAELEELDYDAVVLRIFQRQDFRTVGAALGVSDDTAQKRVTRALEKLRDELRRRGIHATAGALALVLAANAVSAAPAGLAAAISAAALTGSTSATATIIAAGKTIAMTTLQKTLITATVAVLAGAGIYEARQAAQWRTQSQTLQQTQAPLAGQIQQLQRERDAATNRLAGLQAELAIGKSNRLELLKQRGEMARLQNELGQLKQTKAAAGSDPIAMAAQAWVERVKNLQARFDNWPGKTTPELQLLDQQDWLNEAAKTDLNTEADWRAAMSRLRWTAKTKFAALIRQALKEYAQANNGQTPGQISELESFLTSPAAGILSGYEIAKPGWVHPPQPNSPEAKNAETWALVMNGSFTSAGQAIRDGSYLADGEYDMTMVIFNGQDGGSYYGYGPDLRVKK